MARPPESKVYNFQLHRATLWTMGCGLLFTGCLVFVAGSLVGAWWISRPAQVATEVPGTYQDVPASEVPGTYQDVPASEVPGTYEEVPGIATTGTETTSPQTMSPEVPGTSSNPASGLVQGPTATAPAVTGPAVRGPTVSRSGIRGPTVTGPRTAGPRVQGPRLRSPTPGTVGGGRVGGQTVRLSDVDGASADQGIGSQVASASAGAQADGMPPSGSSVDGTIDGVLQDLSPPEEASPPPPVYRYAVQVGLFTQNDDAQALVESLTELGYTPYVQTIRSQKRRVIVRSVRLGPWQTQDAAEEAALHYRTDTGQGTAVVREAVETTSDG